MNDYVNHQIPYPELKDLAVVNHSTEIYDRLLDEYKSGITAVKLLKQQGEYQTTDLNAAMKSGNEIMIRGSSYYAVEFNFATQARFYEVLRKVLK